MRRMLELLIPAIVLAGLVCGRWYLKANLSHLRSAALKYGLLVLLIGVSGSLPLEEFRLYGTDSR